MSSRTHTSARSTARGGRLWGVDAARGLALLGMMTVHAVSTTDDLGEATWTGELLAGRSAALFAVLAGVGLALLTGGTAVDRPNARVSWERRVIAVRAGIIVMIGLAVAMLGSGVAVILVHYGVLFILALPFIRLGFRALAGLAAAWMLAAPVAYFVFQSLLRGQDVLWSRASAETLTMDPPPRLWTSPALPDLLDPYLLFLDLMVTGYYPLLLWPAYLFAGMAMGRLNLHKTRVAVRLLFGGAAVAVLTSMAGRTALNSSSIVDRMQEVSGWSEEHVRGELIAGTHLLPLEMDPVWWAMTTPHLGSPMDLMHTTGYAAAVLGLCLLIARIPWALAPLAGAGSMPLSLYTGHLLVLAAWRATDEAGDPVWPAPEAFRALSGESIALWLVVGALVLGMVKMLLRRRGPLEALTYSAGTALAGRRP